MNPTDYKQTNITMRSGDNTNTIALRTCLSGRSDMPGNIFYVSKWLMDETELAAYKDRIVEVLKDVDIIDQNALVEKIAECLPEIFLSCMGGMMPVNVIVGNPFEQGWMKPLDAIAKSLQPPNSIPTKN